MKTLPLDEQKRAILYAPKDLLWAILEEDSAWLKLFKVLPIDYYNQFLDRLRLLGTQDDNAIRNMAKMYIQNKVGLGHLQEAIAKVWKPDDLEDATSWLKEKGFLSRPLMPMNLQASSTEDVVGVIKEALAMSPDVKGKLVEAAKGERPKLNKPPAGASKEGKKCWNKVLRNKDKRKIILSPRSLEDQWSLAVKFWLGECNRSEQSPYIEEIPTSSYSMHANNVLKRSIRELSNGLCADGYSMSRPASRKLKALFDQLTKDGYSLGEWSSIKPKTHGEI